MLTVIAVVAGLVVGALAAAVWLRTSSGSGLRKADEERR